MWHLAEARACATKVLVMHDRSHHRSSTLPPSSSSRTCTHVVQSLPVSLPSSSSIDENSPPPVPRATHGLAVLPLHTVSHTPLSDLLPQHTPNPNSRPSCDKRVIRLPRKRSCGIVSVALTPRPTPPSVLQCFDI
jgi:hypothetical protein